VRFCRYTHVAEMRRRETRHDPEIAVIRSAVQKVVSEVSLMHVIYNQI